MDVRLVIKQRLEELGLEQRDLASAAEVTESYISQLLTGKKLPPEPSRSDIYDKIGKFLKLPSSRLSRLADHQRKEALKRNLEDPPKPLFREVRELILSKCAPEKRKQMRVIFEKQPFGELERLVTQKLLDVVKKIAKNELQSEKWLHSVARLSSKSYEAMRVSILEFLDTDAFSISAENCVTFLDPLIESWDIFEFVEKELVHREQEPGLKEFLKDLPVNGGVTQEEIEFLNKLTFKGKHPTPLYYYRELQNLRDPLHFDEGSRPTMHKRRDADDANKKAQSDVRKKAIRRWARNCSASQMNSKS